MWNRVGDRVGSGGNQAKVRAIALADIDEPVSQTDQ